MSSLSRIYLRKPRNEGITSQKTRHHTLIVTKKPMAISKGYQSSTKERSTYKKPLPAVAVMAQANSRPVRNVMAPFKIEFFLKEKRH